MFIKTYTEIYCLGLKKWLKIEMCNMSILKCLCFKDEFCVFGVIFYPVFCLVDIIVMSVSVACGFLKTYP